MPISTSFTCVVAMLLAGFVGGYLTRVLPIRHLQAALAEARHDARTDPLTGLANRQHLAATLARLAASSYSVALIDLDDFKPINDRYGHAVGDRVLAAVAGRLARIAHGVPGALAARLGGDEFVLAAIIDPNRLAPLVLEAFATPVPIAGAGPMNVRASVGIAHAVAGTSPGDVLHAADIAMYHAKTVGGGQAVTSTAVSTSYQHPARTRTALRWRNLADLHRDNLRHRGRTRQ